MPDKLPDRRRPPVANEPQFGGYAEGGWQEASLAPLNLRQVLGVIRSHLWLVCAVAAATAAAAAFIAARSEPAYRGTVVVRLADARRALAGGLVDVPAPELGGRPVDPLLSQVAVITSRTVAGAVVDGMPVLQLRVRRFPIALLGDVWLMAAGAGDSLLLRFGAQEVTVEGRTGTARAAYGRAIEVDGIRFTVAVRGPAETGTLMVIDREAAVNDLVAHLRPKPREQTNIIDISYIATNPQTAQEVANRVAEVFQSTNALAAQQQSRLRRQFIEAQLKLNDSLLAGARHALGAFRARKGTFAAGQAFSTEQLNLSQLRARREELVAERARFRRLLAPLQGGRDESSKREALRAAMASPPGGTVNPVVAQLYAQLLQYEAARDSLTAGEWAHAASNPDVKRFETLIASTAAELERAEQDMVNSLDGRIAALDDLMARYATTFAQLSSGEASEARLVEQVENARRMADELQVEYQKARIAEAVEVGQVEIVDRAVLPRAPVGVGLGRLLAFGALLGLLLGGGSAYVAEHLNGSIRRYEEAARLRLPVLGVVPHLKRARHGTATSPVVEALRGVRLSLMHAYGAAGPLLVTVTSPGGREGKSFIATNLALAFAHANYRTLLIDGDTRHGALHRLLNRARKPGLIDALTGTATPDVVIQETTYPSLYFVGSGLRAADAPELLGSAALTRFITGLRACYGAIIIDTAPLGAGIDALALSLATGNVLMVLRLGSTDCLLAEAKLELLARFPVRVLGTVLNDARAGSASRYYSYYLAGYEQEDERGARPVPVLVRPHDGNRSPR